MYDAGKTLKLDGLELSDTIAVVKSKIHDNEGTLPDQQYMFFAGLQREDRETIADCRIQKDFILRLVLRQHMPELKKKNRS